MANNPYENYSYDDLMKLRRKTEEEEMYGDITHEEALDRYSLIDLARVKNGNKEQVEKVLKAAKEGKETHEKFAEESSMKSTTYRVGGYPQSMMDEEKANAARSNKTASQYDAVIKAAEQKKEEKAPLTSSYMSFSYSDLSNNRKRIEEQQMSGDITNEEAQKEYDDIDIARAYNGNASELRDFIKQAEASKKNWEEISKVNVTPLEGAKKSPQKKKADERVKFYDDLIAIAEENLRGLKLENENQAHNEYYGEIARERGGNTDYTPSEFVHSHYDNANRFKGAGTRGGVYGFLTEDELNTLNALHNSDNPEFANDYFEGLKPALERRLAYKETEEAQQFGEEHPGIAGAESVIRNVVGGIPAAADNLIEGIFGDVNTYDSTSRYLRKSQAYRQGGSQYMNDKYGEGAAWAYNTGLSIVENTANVVLFKGAGSAASALISINMASNAAAQQMINIADRGGSDAQIIIGGAVSGITEYFFEKVSFDRLLDPSAAKNLLGVMKNGLAQSGVEMSEELFTEASNIFLDAVIMQNKSENAIKRRKYVIEDGLTAEEAAKKVLTESIDQILKAAASGLVSGGIMGTGASYIQSRSRNNYMAEVGERVMQNPKVMNRLVELGVKSENKEANAIAETIKEGYDVTPKEVGRMIDSVVGQSIEKDGGLTNITNTIRALEGRTSLELREGEDFESAFKLEHDTSKAVMHMAQGKATDADRALLSRSNGAMTLLSAIEGNSKALKSIRDRASVQLRESKTEVRNAEYGMQSEDESNPDLSDEDLDEYIKTGKKLHTRNKKQRMLEMGKSPILTTKDSVKKFISDVINGKAQGEVRAFKKVGKRLAEAILQKRRTLNTLGKYLELNADDLRESYKRHSAPKESGDIPLTEQDFERIPEYLDEFDGVLGVNTYNDKTEVHLYKETEDGYIKILTVVSNERNSLQVTKLIGVSKEKFLKKYTKKIEGSTGSPQGQTKDPNPSTTARRTADAPSNKSLSQNKPTVKDSDIYSQGKRVSIPEGAKKSDNIVITEESERFRKKNPEGYKITKILAKDLGMKVMFVDELIDADGNILDGAITSEGIFINSNAKNIGKFVVTHEFSHRMKDTAPEAWKRYQEYVIEREKVNGRYYDRFNAKADAYGDNAEVINEEIACDYIGELFSNESELIEFLRQDRGLAVTVRDIYYGVLNRLGFLDEKKKAQLLWRKAYKEAVLNKDKVFEGEKEKRSKIDRKSRTHYNEYMTNALSWARATDRKVGDMTVINANYDSAALIEATEDGFVELAKGSHKEMREKYEQAYRRATDEIYGNLESIKNSQGADNWSLQYAENGRNDDGNSEQVGNKELQNDTSGNDEHLRSSNKRKSVSGTRLPEYESETSVEESEDTTVKAIPPGAMPRREVVVPRSVQEGTRVRQFARTAAEAETLTDKTSEGVLVNVEKGKFNYTPVSDKKAMNNAYASLDAMGVEWVEKKVNGAISAHKLDKNTVAMAEALMERYSAEGREDEAQELIINFAAESTRIAQSLQAISMLKKLNPDYEVSYIDKIVENLKEEIIERNNKKWLGKKQDANIEVSEELKAKLRRARTEEERAQIREEIYTQIAEQVPSSWIDKWNAWRYLAMLGNPRTHIRNVFGNAFFMPMIASKNISATIFEAAVDKISGGKIERTKTFNVPKEYKQFALADAESMREELSGGGKHNPSNMIKDRQKVFNFEPIEWMRIKVGDALEIEDWLFLKFHYRNALAQYLAANKVDLASIDEKTLGRARNIAIKEAQRNTYRDASAFANALSKFSQKNAATAILVEGLMPFKKTPVNVLKRGIEYSPAGLVKALTVDLRKVAKGDITASEYIDGLCAGLTGTGVIALGMLLKSLGLVSGASDDDKEKEFDELTGVQNYSLSIGGHNYTLDWLAPFSLPFFTGVEMQNIMENKGDISFRNIVDTLSNMTEPFFEMSMLQGLTGAVDTIKQANSAETFGNVAWNVATNYMGQAVPTLFGQIARTVDGTQRRSYDDKNKNIPSDLQYFLQSQIKKIPWASQNLEPYVDGWGRQEKIENVFLRAVNNMFSPGYYSQINASPMEKELQRLYKEVGSEDNMKLFPTSAVKKFNLSDGTEKNLTAKEYTTIQTVQGQTAYKLVEGIVESKSYKDVDDFTKGRIVSKVYEVASANGKKAVAGNEWNPDSKWISEALTLIEKGDYKGAEKYITEKGVEEVEDSRFEASKNEYKESFVYDASDYSESEINIMDKVESDAATYYASIEKGREYNESNLRHIKVYDEKLKDEMPIEEYAGVRAYAKKTAAMEDGKASMKKDELYNYLESTDYPRSVKSALYEAIGNKGWKNPYTGKKIQ